MDLTHLANLGEFIGGVAVVVTLIYLAIQVRQANETDRKAGMTEILTLYERHAATVGSDEHVESFLKGLRDYWGLGPTERVKFNMCMAGYVNVIETIVTYAGPLGEGEKPPFVDAYFGARLFAYAGFREWWGHTEHEAWLPETVAAVDQGLQTHRTTAGFWDSPGRSSEV